MRVYQEYRVNLVVKESFRVKGSGGVWVHFRGTIYTRKCIQVSIIEKVNKYTN